MKYAQPLLVVIRNRVSDVEATNLKYQHDEDDKQPESTVFGAHTSYVPQRNFKLGFGVAEDEEVDHYCGEVNLDRDLKVDDKDYTDFGGVLVHMHMKVVSLMEVIMVQV